MSSGRVPLLHSVSLFQPPLQRCGKSSPGQELNNEHPEIYIDSCFRDTEILQFNTRKSEYQFAEQGENLSRRETLGFVLLVLTGERPVRPVSGTQR